MSVDLQQYVDQARSHLAAQGLELSQQSVADALRSQGHVVGATTVGGVHARLARESSGLGPLETLLADSAVTDILVNGAGQIWSDAGGGLQRHPQVLQGETEVRRLAERLASQAGRRIDDASPFVDAILPSGIRLHAALAPVARPGTLISLRIPRSRHLPLADLVEAGSLHPELCAVLREAVRARLAFLISGGTGSGKTTLLSTLLAEVPTDQRLVVVEDSNELRPPHPHVVSLEGRPANLEGAGAITLQMLVRQALRMRPDRLVVGEVRGAEVADLLAALNTGHEGGCGTIHANAPSVVPARIEALGMLAGLPQQAIHSQLIAALDLVIHVRRSPSGRQVSSLAVITKGSTGLAQTQTALSVQGDRLVEGPGAAALARRLRGEGERV